MRLTSETIESTGTATYCPEDDKLRLYVGRVPREEYDALRAQGWTSTPKQSCDFVAVWTPEREDTALAYGAGYIDDEDQSPADRAADRAERFDGYAEKRMSEAMDRADRYEAGPAVVGCQSLARAERQVNALERQAVTAVCQWGKAEYWQRRTEGVIAHALHRSAPGVRMGRIKVIEAEIRQIEANYTPDNDAVYMVDGAPHVICGQNRARHYVAVDKLERIKAAFARSVEHLKLRLAYENQMLEAQGGRAASLDMEPGGWIGEYQVMKVNKSTVTGRVVSVAVKVPKVHTWTYKTVNVPGTDYALLTIDTERLSKSVYRAPTDEERAAFVESKKAEKKAKKETTPKGPALVNPTKEDAERLQAVWNAQKVSYEPGKVLEMTQAEYSAMSKSAYARAQVYDITGGGFKPYTNYNAVNFPTVAKVRGQYGNVIVLTDKPQKAFDAEVWEDPRPALRAEVAARIEEVYKIAHGDWLRDWTDEEKNLWRLALLVDLAKDSSMSQKGLTKEGWDVYNAKKQEAVAV